MLPAATPGVTARGAIAIPARPRRSARVRLALLLAPAALVLSGSATALPAPGAGAGTASAVGAPVSPSGLMSTSPPTRRASAAAALSDAQLAGQRVIYSYSGLQPPARLLAQIHAGQAGGVIFFSDNVSSLAQIRGVVRQLQRAAAQSPVKTPLLLMTDQEGGLVRRLPGAPALSEKQVGQSTRADPAARGAGRGAGQTLAGVGMNLNLSPVLDVYRASGNFIDEFGRSFSSHASTAARLGADFISAQQAVGVDATAKHFPGLGAATRNQNTDLASVTLNLSLHSLHTVDELPYAAAIRAGVKLVMASWATYPALDARRPAGLSARVIGSELRGRLRFTGVTITDTIASGALRSFGSTGQRAALAAAAGMDLILCAELNAGQNTPSQGVAALQGLTAALHAGRLRRASFTASVNRVLALRRALGR